MHRADSAPVGKRGSARGSEGPDHGRTHHIGRHQRLRRDAFALQQSNAKRCNFQHHAIIAAMDERDDGVGQQNAVDGEGAVVVKDRMLKMQGAEVGNVDNE